MMILRGYAPSTFEEEFKLADKIAGVEHEALLNDSELDYSRLSRGKVCVCMSIREFEVFMDEGFVLRFRQNKTSSEGDQWVKIDFHLDVQSSIVTTMSYLAKKGYFEEESRFTKFETVLVFFNPRSASEKLPPPPPRGVQVH